MMVTVPSTSQQNCAHTLLLLQHTKSNSYQSVKKRPNLVTTDMPKGRGRKGSKVPTKRKQSTPIEKRIELNPESLNPPASESLTKTVGMEVHISPSVTPVYQPSLNAPISVTVGASSPHPGTFTPCTSTNFPMIPPFGPSTSPYLPHYPPMYSTPYPSSSSPYMPTPPSSYCGPDPTNGGAHPFRVHFITGNTRRMHGIVGERERSNCVVDMRCV